MNYDVNGLISALGNSYYIIVYAIGVLAMVFSIIAFQFKHKAAIILLSFFGQVCWVAYFLLQGDLTSAIACWLSAVILFAYTKSDKWMWVSSPITLVIFILLLSGFSLLSFKVWADIFPLLGGVFTVVANSSKTEKLLRQFSVLTYLFWILNGVFKVYPVALINDTLCLASTIIGLIRYRDKKNPQNDECVVK